MEYIHQPWAGNDSLVTHMAETRAQIPEQIKFQVIARRKVSMSALAGEDMMLETVPVHAGFAQSSSGCDYRLIANGTSFHLVQTNDVLGSSAGIPQAFASRSLMSSALRSFNSSASRLDSIVHGRLDASTRPLRTGPATPKQAASGRTLELSTNLVTISSRPRYSRLGNTEAETRLKWPSTTSKNASLAWVPPMSPARIIFRSSSSGARRAQGVLRLPSDPRFQRDSLENFAEEAPSTHRGQN